MTDGRVAVIGGGVAGLATALNILDRARDRDLPVSVTVFEKDDHPGGNLRTLKQDGWQLEWGPNGFLDNEPATLRLVDRLGLRDDLVRSSDAARRRFLVVDDRLQEIPTSPKAFLKSEMMSTRAKLRLAGELFVPARKDLGRAAEDPNTDETIDQFGTRRLGKAFAETMLDPMVKGVFGGESRQLSLAAAFPRMVELERDYGGLFADEPEAPGVFRSYHFDRTRKTPRCGRSRQDPEDHPCSRHIFRFWRKCPFS
jgi:oxygen-dependent protoporphyrinogen oxidase